MKMELQQSLQLQTHFLSDEIIELVVAIFIIACTAFSCVCCETTNKSALLVAVRICLRGQSYQFESCPQEFEGSCKLNSTIDCSGDVVGVGAATVVSK